MPGQVAVSACGVGSVRIGVILPVTVDATGHLCPGGVIGVYIILNCLHVHDVQVTGRSLKVVTLQTFGNGTVRFLRHLVAAAAAGMEHGDFDRFIRYVIAFFPDCRVHVGACRKQVFRSYRTCVTYGFIR